MSWDHRILLIQRDQNVKIEPSNRVTTHSRVAAMNVEKPTSNPGAGVPKLFNV